MNTHVCASCGAKMHPIEQSLIDAAPLMLDTLERLKIGLSGLVGLNPCLATDIEKIDAAINRATGTP
jgi:hypothetical protein